MELFTALIHSIDVSDDATLTTDEDDIYHPQGAAGADPKRRDVLISQTTRSTHNAPDSIRRASLANGAKRSSVATQRIPKKLDHACIGVKSIVRTGASLGSPEAGTLRVGTMVVQIDQCTLPDGVVRSWVARESEPRGINIEPVGWITSFKPKSAGATGQNALERPMAGETLESLSSRIVQRHMSLTTESVVEAPTVGPGNWMTIDALTLHAAAQRTLARNLEEKVFDECQERVGILLVELDMVPEDEVPRRCDAIGAGEELGRLMFRSLVRGLKAPGALITQDSMLSPIYPATLEAL